MTERPGEHPRGSTGPTRLSRLGFLQPDRAERDLAAAGLWPAAGADADPATEACLTDLADTADPDRAAALLARLVAAQPGPALVRALRSRAGLRARLFGVLGASAALGEHLVSHPDDWRELLDDQVTAVRPSPLGLRRRLGAATDPTGLQREYRRCLLGLAARDLSGTVAVEDVAGELADLAAATLTAALELTRPADPACRLAVIGMGKCGGRELNYVSDVDVIFVAEPAEGRDEPAALQVATDWASAVVRTCAEVAWPVDTALRPEGKSGPLVRTLASHLAYYRRWARTWEFQALLKARPVAGDSEVGQAYLTQLAPLVWHAAERPGFVADVQDMRRRVERSLPSRTADREMKLGPGGLRDVEFAVQLLQLVHGRSDESVRSPTTLVALDQLADGGYIGREDARRLAAAYRWLRTVEHRLQLDRLRRTHLVPAPDDQPALRRLARACGYRADPVATFERDRAGYARDVRRLHEKLFYRPLLAAAARLPTADVRLTPAAARARLEALGFDDPAAALRQLTALTAGSSRRAQLQQTLLPVMLGWFAAAADPDAGLLSFRQVSDALGGTPWYLRLLRDEGATAERLARLLASSRYVAELLVRAPEGVRLLARDEDLQPRTRAALTAAFTAAAVRRDDWEPAVAAVRGLRRQELLRVACADLLGVLPADAVGPALSDIAAATVAAGLAVATRKIEAERRGQLPVRLAVIAMGRLGGGEQGYASDVDVLFVHEPVSVPDAEAAAAAHDVANELRRLLALPAPDPPVLLDADLRPEGRQGPLTRSRASSAAYYARWSLVWEAQALLRAAPLAGDEELAAGFLDDIAPVRWPAAGLPEEQVREVRRVKARVEAERLPRGVDPALALKLGRGGIADVEWTVQLLQLQHAGRIRELRTSSTVPALRAAAAHGLLDSEDADRLVDAWTIASRARDALMLVRGRPAEVLPTSGRELAGVALAMGYPPGEQAQLLEDYRRAARRARAVVDRVFYG